MNRNFVSRKLSQAEGGKGTESIACLAKESLHELIEVWNANTFWGILQRWVIDLPTFQYTANLNREKASISFPLFNYVSALPCASAWCLAIPQVPLPLPRWLPSRQAGRTKRVLALWARGPPGAGPGGAGLCEGLAVRAAQLPLPWGHGRGTGEALNGTCPRQSHRSLNPGPWHLGTRAHLPVRGSLYLWLLWTPTGQRAQKDGTRPSPAPAPPGKGHPTGSPLCRPGPGPQHGGRPGPALRARGVCGGAGGGGAAPQSRAAEPLPAAINSARPNMSRPPQRLQRWRDSPCPPAASPARSAVRGLREPRGAPGGRGGGLRGGPGSSGRRAGAARHPRPRGTSALRVQGSGAESRLVPVCSFSLFFQTALSRAGRVPPASRSRAGRLGSLPASPPFPLPPVGRVARGGGWRCLEAQPPAPRTLPVPGLPGTGLLASLSISAAPQPRLWNPGCRVRVGRASLGCGSRWSRGTHRCLHEWHPRWASLFGHTRRCSCRSLPQVFSSAADVAVDRVDRLYGGVNRAGLCPLSWLLGDFWEESS